MPIVRIPYPNALPTEQNDYVKQNNLIEAGFLQVNKPIWESGGNIVQGAVFQVGGTVYHCTGATAIGGVASAYIKLTPSGDGSSLAPSYVANLGGVTWNSAYNGYYDVSGNVYVFDELLALYENQITTLNNKLWNAINISNNVKLGEMGIVLTNYTTTGVPQIAAGSWVEINGQMYRISANIAIGGATVNNTWYDILLTPAGGTFTASYIARNTGVWSDSKQGLYSGNNRVVACVKRSTSVAIWINKNILPVINRTCKIKMIIGDWDMDTVSIATVNHSVTLIKSISGVIRNDTNDMFYTIGTGNDGTGGASDVAFREIFPIAGYDVTNSYILRRAGGAFDNANFNSTSYNRGDLFIEYEV